MNSDIKRISEQIELLAGERGEATKPLSAIRRTELRGLVEIGIQSSQVSAAPTQDEFNALQKDVDNIFRALTLISNAYGTAKIPKL